MTNNSYKYSELGPLMHSGASGFINEGLQNGDVVFLTGPNSPEFLLTFNAIAAAGGTVALCNSNFTESNAVIFSEY